MQELWAKEQQEEQVLRDITGVQRLEDVTFLDAVVDCSETSLSNLGEKMPLLRELKLNNSALSSVRNLGSKLQQLQVLWISHCGLTGLDGLNALPSLRELYAAYNHIDNLEPVADMEKLEVLDLEGNEVDDLGALVYLGWCPQLAVLNLADNPVAQEPTYSAQVCAALPKLHLLDETMLDRPLSPVSKLAHPHRQTHPGTTGPDGHASSLVANRHTSAQAILADTALCDFGLGMMPGSELSQHARSNVLLAKASMRPLRQQRPASASSLQQRLPPVAVGHNQPGSYLLYSLNQLPSKAPQFTAEDGMTAVEHMSAPNFRAVVATTQHHSEALSLDKSRDSAVFGSVSGGVSTCADSKRVRPASAGIRRADSRLQNPSVFESSRPGSADGNAGRSAGLEAAGLYWRKHRLILPQGYAMTATQAQAAADPAAAEPQGSESADATHADTDKLTGFNAEDQQQAIQTSTEEQPDVLPLHSESEDVIRENVADRDFQMGSSEHDSLAGADSLIIEDAGELTCDQAAVILRQLSCECQAAESCARIAEAICSTSAADQEQQYVTLHQVERDADCRSATSKTGAISAAAALTVPAGAEMQLDEAKTAADRPEEQVMLLQHTGTVADTPAEQTSEVQHRQPSISGNAVHAAGVQRNSGWALRLPAGQSSSSIATLSDGLAAASQQASPGRHVSRDAVCASMEGGHDHSAASITQPGVFTSSFLQRLQMSKPATATGLNATSPQGEDSRQGERGAARPPSPERPPTPSSWPARRRHLTPAFTEAEPLTPKAPSWAGTNQMFAPMPQQVPVPWNTAHTHAQAPLPARPATASVAECPRLAGSELSWTGSMQLPAGLLKLAARPHQAPIGRKDKHRYDWGFGTARGLV